MSDQSQISVFIIKSPKHNISAVEMYMKKRGFLVESQSDLKIALQRIIETTPKYTLLAWDYPNDKITQLPKLLLQSVMTQIIPFSASSEKQHIRQLQISQFPNKIYPPLSGPAIQRLILKLEKGELESEKRTQNDKNQNDHTDSSDSDTIQVRSSIDNNDLSLDQILNSSNSDSSASQQGLISAGQGQSQIYLDKGQRANELRSRQNLKRNMNLQADVNETVEKSSNAESNAEQDFENSVVHNKALQQFKLERSMKLAALFRDKSEVPEKNPAAATASSSVSPLKNIIASQSQELHQDIKDKLQSEFNSFIQEQISDHLQFQNTSESNSEIHLEKSRNESVRSESVFETDRLLCLIINTAHWTGYVLIASEIDFDSESLKNIVTAWFRECLPSNQDQFDLEHSFQIDISAINFIHFSESYADFFKVAEHDTKKTVLSFFRIDPHLLDVQLHDTYDMIELDLQEIPTDLPLRFDIHLFLPENKKFILYCKKESAIAIQQHERLQIKAVDTLYSQLENEFLIQQHRAEKIINLMIQEYLLRKKI